MGIDHGKCDTRPRHFAHKFIRQASAIILGPLLLAGLSACGATIPPKGNGLGSGNGNSINAASSVSSNSSASPAKLNAKTSAGYFLAARQALYFNNMDQSASFFLETLKDDTDNVDLLRQTFLTQYYQGDIVKAAALGRRLESLNISAAFRAEPATAIAIQNKDWQAVLVLADTIHEHYPSLGLAALIRGWALVATGQGDAGITHLMEAAQSSGDGETTSLPGLHYAIHAALMTEYLGNSAETVRRVMALVEAPMTPLNALQIAAILARNGELETANQLVEKRLNDSFSLDDVTFMLADKVSNKAPTIIQNIAQGIVDFSSATDVQSEQRILSARLQIALFLDPKNDTTRLLLGHQYLEVGNYSDAVRVLSAVKGSGPLGQTAMILLSDIANDTENHTQATTILNQIIEINPDEGYLHKLLGDSHRRAGNYANARDAYYQALKFGYSGSGLHRNLGVALEQLGQTEDAETHLETAIAQNPNDAFALNYLGYWWADQGRNLEQAIALIERAVRLRPDSGYFVDSLGWVHFRLGDADKAVGLLEQATALEPSDFEIIGHLGDVYWYLNRYDEARFKWRLALSLAKDKAEQNKFQDRLEHGLTKTTTGSNL